MGAECCPYKMLFLAAKSLPSLVGIGREMNQAGNSDYLPVSHKPIPTRVSHFWLSIGINLSLDPGFRRGEGGWGAGWGAFLVARCGVLHAVGCTMHGPSPPTHGRP